ncbi:MAG: hypothetical protein KDB79_02610 [Acidobacteria bacterium]|nr:hypothetical protein [Acidobacteriota bacterium]
MEQLNPSSKKSTNIEQPKPAISPLQAEILDDKNSKTESPIGQYDFRNSTFPLPRGWEDIDSKEVTLVNGIREMTEDKIGMAYVTTKYFDVTGDGVDEAFVILKVSTGSITIPQIVYIYDWKDDEPNLLWYFRTGDRSDGGLKRIGMEDGKLLIELFGRDRYIFTQMETGKIIGDEERLCCPTHFTRTLYKHEGNNFRLDGDRWTYSLEDKDAEPEKNMNEVKLEEERGTKK